MNIIEKVKLIDKLSIIFTIKSGKRIKKEKICHQVPKWVSVFFKFYYLAPVYTVVFFLFLLMPHFFENLYMQVAETLVLYVLVEYLFLLVLPIKKVPCSKYT